MREKGRSRFPAKGLRADFSPSADPRQTELLQTFRGRKRDSRYVSSSTRNSLSVHLLRTVSFSLFLKKIASFEKWGDCQTSFSFPPFLRLFPPLLFDDGEIESACIPTALTSFLLLLFSSSSFPSPPSLTQIWAKGSGKEGKKRDRALLLLHFSPSPFIPKISAPKKEGGKRKDDRDGETCSAADKFALKKKKIQTTEMMPFSNLQKPMIDAFQRSGREVPQIYIWNSRILV